MNYKKEKKTKDVKLNKKAMSFINLNFPDYNKINVIEDSEERVVTLLDYGKNEPKLKVEIVKTLESANLYRLMDTQLVY